MSLLKLRPDLLRFAPDVAARFGLRSEDIGGLEAEEAALETAEDLGATRDVDEGYA